jgi:release factor glutamine methyltransferase
MFRTLLRPLPRLLKWYLSRERNFRYQDLTITVMPGVFHPGFFHSSILLLDFLRKQTLTGSVLEIGCGTGIVSIQAAKQGATVVCTDISLKAVENARRNAELNSVAVTVIHSDLFENVESGKFDWIVVNPPYYPRDPVREEDYAWYCGETHQYFTRFFKGLKPFISENTSSIMVLSEVCDLPAIFKIAMNEGFVLQSILEKAVWVDGRNYLFQIKRTS